MPDIENQYRYEYNEISACYRRYFSAGNIVTPYLRVKNVLALFINSFCLRSRAVQVFCRFAIVYD
jgi:hypothetical protein